MSADKDAVGLLRGYMYESNFASCTYEINVYSVLNYINTETALQCVKEYLTVMISQGNVLAITCPDAMCGQHGLIESDEVGPSYSSVVL